MARPYASVLSGLPRRDAGGVGSSDKPFALRLVVTDVVGEEIVVGDSGACIVVADHLSSGGVHGRGCVDDQCVLVSELMQRPTVP